MCFSSTTRRCSSIRTAITGLTWTSRHPSASSRRNSRASRPSEYRRKFILLSIYIYSLSLCYIRYMHTQARVYMTRVPWPTRFISTCLGLWLVALFMVLLLWRYMCFSYHFARSSSCGFRELSNARSRATPLLIDLDSLSFSYFFLLLLAARCLHCV